MAKQKKIALMSSVLVWWLDAAVTPGWHAGDKLHTVDMSPALSCGFLVHRNRRRIVLGLTIDGDGDVGHCFAIPRSQIIKIEATRTPGAMKL